MEKVTREQRKTIDYTKLLGEKIQQRVQEAKARREAEEEAQGEKAQEAQKTKKKEGVDENAIRELTLKELHDEMDKQVAKRASRLQYAALMRDTTTQWDLVAATVQEANTSYHGLTGSDVVRMGGRSTTTYKKKVKYP